MPKIVPIFCWVCFWLVSVASSNAQLQALHFEFSWISLWISSWISPLFSISCRIFRHISCVFLSRPISSHFAPVQLSGLAEPLLSRFDLALALRSQGGTVGVAVATVATVAVLKSHEVEPPKTDWDEVRRSGRKLPNVLLLRWQRGRDYHFYPGCQWPWCRLDLQ